MDMCLLEVAMCEKFRSSHFQWEGGVQSLGTGGRGLKNFRTGEGYQFGGTFSGGGLVPHDMTCYFHLPIDPSNCAKLKKNSYSRPRVMTMRHFWT